MECITIKHSEKLEIMSENKHIILFEHHKYDYGGSKNPVLNLIEMKELEVKLSAIWDNLISKPSHNNFYSKTEEEERADEVEEDVGNDNIDKELKQRFISIVGATKFKPNNYIGFIQHGDKVIEIYPKVFYKNGEIKPAEKNNWLQHIFFWLKHCDWLPARINQTSLDNTDIDNFPGFLIYYIATLIEDTVSQKPYSRYEEVEEILQSPKGRINFPAYINHGLSNGNWHQIDCVYEPFVYDNKVNQVIKYVTRVLKYKAKKESIPKLDNIVFILDEVEDRVCTIQEIERIQISDLFSEYKEILYWCKMILEQQTFNNDSYNSDNFCFLLPMEKIFEGFVAGVLKEEYNELIGAQNINNLATTGKFDQENVFQIKPDITKYKKEITEKKEIEYILDTKYKVRKQDENDKKGGVSQSDMYQMVSYAKIKKCDSIYLIYPSKDALGDKANLNVFKIIDTKIVIKAQDIFIYDKLIDGKVNEIGIKRNIIGKIEVLKETEKQRNYLQN